MLLISLSGTEFLRFVKGRAILYGVFLVLFGGDYQVPVWL